MFTNKSGFSLVEIIIAMAIFSIIVAGGLTGFIPVLNQNRQSTEIIQASRLAQEGLEAVRSIRDRNFALLSEGNSGIGISNNLWNFSGVSDITGKFTRQISLVSTTDPDVWQVKSLITWNYNPSETKQFSLETILTNWRKSIGVNYDGVIVYGNDSSVTPFWNSYTNSSNVFGTKVTMPALIGNPRNFVIKTSPQKTEAIAGTVTSSGVLYIYCFNGNNWTQDWSVTVGGAAETRRFDIAYETNSGNTVVLYSTNNSNANELNFKTKTGSSGCGSGNWSTSTNYDPFQTSGVVQWVKMASNPKNNLIATTWADSNSDLSASIWNGSTFQNEPSSVTESSLEFVSASQDVDDFDLTYESLSGDLMLVWANSVGKNGTNGVRYRLCTGNSANCTWGTNTTPPTFSDDATNLDISANSNSDEIVFASIGNAKGNLQIGYWNGNNWTNKANVDTSTQTPFTGSKLVTTGWLISNTTARSIIVYADNKSNNVNWYLGNQGTFSPQTDFAISPKFAATQNWFKINTDPKNQNQLMLTVADNNSNLFAKRLIMTSTPAFTWTNSDGGAAIETNLGQPIVNPFGFAYWQK